MSLSKSLPREMVLEILKRLPVKPLMRFKCVSKSWRLMIDDPDFVAMHLKHSALGGTNWYLLLKVRYPSREQKSSLYPDKSLTVDSQIEIEVPFVSPTANYSFVGSCNGLICVSEKNTEHGSWTFFLWNLFTRKYKAVQSSSLNFAETRTVLGFGYSDRINDYKVVRITHCRDKYGGFWRGLVSEVEVYSLSTDTWRAVEFDRGCKLCDLSTVSFNGNLHWMSILADGDCSWCCGSITTFGVADEVFNEMPLPKSLVGVPSVEVNLEVLNGSLVLLISHVNWRNLVICKCDVWVMTEYGMPESWTKLHTIHLNGDVGRFRGFTRSAWD
ncbi:F-box/kelch-repeat protein At3g23880-like [Rhodamnia argentea]|uniref:F-box/kelch-repeat protein At3g23880-like n=1 Tax=Rhodamnia argentea TaxID=178133 RepID=A0ABM3GVM5_9MYRT|nr:F-box/kelch-repeat protein At3g23880-like [Rhodamnia argentea]